MVSFSELFTKPWGVLAGKKVISLYWFTRALYNVYSIFWVLGSLIKNAGIREIPVTAAM